ncbi:MAG TPA: acyltransferase family protein [Acidimicrobiales bacterium]
MTIDVRVDAGAAPRTSSEAEPGTGACVNDEAAGTGPRAPGRLRHEPALDGLRGLAVAVVVLFHLGRLDGGFLGVDLFFVLSGYLITSLLLVEHRRTGAIGLGGFWARRARRLLPALLALLVGVAVLLLAFTPEAQRAGFRDDALATLGYVANWQRMVAEVGYWDMFSQPSPLDHMWSLAVEEQFYLLWPLLAVAVLGRRGAPGVRALALGVVALAGAAASFVLLALTYDGLDTNRAYFGTDTRIGPTLLGATLAAARLATAPAWVGTASAQAVARRSRGPAGQAVALAALAWLAWSVVAVDGVAPWYYRGGLLTFAVAAVVLVRQVTGNGGTGPVARALSWAPLRGLGTISYGVYLWHWPVIVYLTPERSRLDRVALDVARVLLTLAMALASFVVVEQPIRRGTFAPARLRVVGAGAAAVALAAVLVATTGTPPPAEAGPGDMASTFDPNNEWARTHRHLPLDVPPGVPRLLLVGDSGVARLGPDLRVAGEAAGVSVGFSSEGFCSVIFPDVVSRADDGTPLRRPSMCSEDRREIWRTMIRRFDPDVVIHYLANGGGIYKEHLDGEWVWDCDEPYDRYLRTELGEELEMLASGGAKVLFATTPYVNPEVERSPSADERVDCRNDTYRAVVADHPGSEIIDLNAFVEEQRTATGEPLFDDNVHLDPHGVDLVDAWLLAQAQPWFPEPTAEEPR